MGKLKTIPVLKGSDRFQVSIISNFQFPDAQCMEYLPTFTIEISQMEVNWPYIEHLGLDKATPTPTPHIS